MLIVLSHALAFSSLFLGSIFDLKTTEVPDPVSLVGVTGGIALHFLASLEAGFHLNTLMNPSVLFQSPLVWLQALGDPLLWCLGAGIVFSIYGWGLYFLGMWGGADAFAMSVLGFAAPYSVSGFGILHGLNLFINVMVVGFLYTLAFSLFKAAKRPEIWEETWSTIKDEEKRISVELAGAGLLGVLGAYTGSFNGIFYFLFLTLLIFLYRFMSSIQEGFLSREVPVSELEGGEVLAAEEDRGGKIVGITEEEIQEIEKEKVRIREGIRFVPVFPIALILTDVFGLGIEFFQLLIS